MKVSAQWVDGICFLGNTESGHSVVMDGAPAAGGHNRGVRPMELLLLGIAGCSSIDVVNIIKKQRQNIDDCIASVSAERADTEPKVFTKIHVHFDVYGQGLKEDAVAKAVALSAEKYCSASIMLSKACEVTHSFSVKAAK